MSPPGAVHVWEKVVSPIHFDSGHLSIPAREYNAPANKVWRKGIPAFGTLCSCNASGSSLCNLGDAGEAPWLTRHQIGNRRHHNSHWLLTEIYRESKPPRPALNGEPYYPGFPPGRSAPADSPEAELYNRSRMYGSFLSGGLAGRIYGCAGLWSGSVEPEAEHRIWEAPQFRSGAEMPHLARFALSEGRRYQELVPDADLVEPNRTSEITGNRGWAYCARTPDRALFMIYFEADCPCAQVRGAAYRRIYHATWFDPHRGEWIEAGMLAASDACEFALPAFPGEGDWALRLKRIGQTQATDRERTVET